MADDDDDDDEFNGNDEQGRRHVQEAAATSAVVVSALPPLRPPLCLPSKEDTQDCHYYWLGGLSAAHAFQRTS
jgi:hypothetical protein